MIYYIYVLPLCRQAVQLVCKPHPAYSLLYYISFLKQISQRPVLDLSRRHLQQTVRSREVTSRFNCRVLKLVRWLALQRMVVPNSNSLHCPRLCFPLIRLCVFRLLLVSHSPLCTNPCIIQLGISSFLDPMSCLFRRRIERCFQPRALIAQRLFLVSESSRTCGLNLFLFSRKLVF